ncbi:MAG: CU044_5270 family protein [Actinomycetota bacterium]
MTTTLRRPPERDLPPGRLAERKQHLLEELSRATDVDAPSRVTTRRRRWRVAAAVGAAAVALAIAVPVILPDGSPGGAGSAEAGRVLRRLASVAGARSPQPGPEPGQFVYTKSRDRQQCVYVVGNGESNVMFAVRSGREAWIGPDGSGRLVTTHDTVTFASDRDRQSWIDAGSPELLSDETGDERFEPGGLSFVDVSNLPRDRHELLALIEKRELVGGPEGDWETFVIVGDLLRETWAPPAVRAALYEVAANLPEVEFIGTYEDELGRVGVAVAYPMPQGFRQEYAFDPETAELLGERHVMVDPEAMGLDIGPDTYPGTTYCGVGDPGDVVYSNVYLESGLVDSAAARP